MRKRIWILGIVVALIFPLLSTAEDDISVLKSKNLALPVQKLQRTKLVNNFYEIHSGHVHEAMDILAPRNTPVMAVDDGVIAKLWLSGAGGITIYQFDPSGRYAYYYAHLEKYIVDIKEGDEVKKGQIIGYVGTSGNAPPNTPHLHFTIFKLTPEKHWWEGTAINPYEVYSQ